MIIFIAAGATSTSSKTALPRYYRRDMEPHRFLSAERSTILMRYAAAGASPERDIR